MHFRAIFKPVCMTNVLFGLLLVFSWGDTYAAGKDAMNTELVLPLEVQGWKWDGRDETYNTQTIFKYIDGAGEVYLAYGLKGLITRRFEKQGKPPPLLMCTKWDLPPMLMAFFHSSGRTRTSA